MRANPADPDIRPLLYTVIRFGIKYGEWPDIFNKVKVLLDAEPLANSQQRIDPYILEVCLLTPYRFIAGDFSLRTSRGLVLMNYLLDHGISVGRSGILAILIRDRAPEDEILKLLDGGADVNAYSGENPEHRPLSRHQYTPLQAAAAAGSLGWVRMLIQRGADVNQPAKGEYGHTALQAACDCDTPDIDMIKFLIDNGADVNAPPSSYSGITALQAAAQKGDFEVVLLLLENGADINAPPPSKEGLCALDYSIWYHKLDMVQFLLDLGALSDDRGESGYKGAIRLAEQHGYLAIVDMIRHHALKNGKSGEELFANGEQSGDYYSGSGDDSDDTDEASGTWLENQDNWEDWLRF